MRRRRSTRDVAVVLVCGGRVAGAARTPDRTLADLAGRTLLERALASVAVPAAGALVVVSDPPDHPRVRALLARRAGAALPPPTVVAPGPTPAAAVHAGLRAIADRITSGELRTVLVHDGSWPLASRVLALQAIGVARRHAAAAPCISQPDSVWVHDDGRTTAVPFGHDDVVLQFPQAFAAADLLAAFEREEAAGYPGATACAVYERRTGRRVHAVVGEPRNVEIRSPRDLFAAQVLLEVADFVHA